MAECVGGLCVILSEIQLIKFPIYADGKKDVRMPRSMHTPEYRLLLTSLIALRRGARVTQIELARRLGKTQGFVSSVERGDRRIDVIEFSVIVHALGADPAARGASSPRPP